MNVWMKKLLPLCQILCIRLEVRLPFFLFKHLIHCVCKRQSERMHFPHSSSMSFFQTSETISLLCTPALGLIDTLCRNFATGFYSKLYSFIFWLLCSLKTKYVAPQIYDNEWVHINSLFFAVFSRSLSKFSFESDDWLTNTTKKYKIEMCEKCIDTGKKVIVFIYVAAFISCVVLCRTSHGTLTE